MTARLYWYPRATAALHTIDVPQTPNDLQVVRDKVTGGGISLGGAVNLVPMQGYDRVRLVVERRSERLASLYEWRDEARTLVDHLLRGGSVGFALDTTKAFLCTPGSPFVHGLSSVGVSGNALASWEAAATLSADDRLVISSSNPDRMREEATVASFTAGTLGLDRAIRFQHSGLTSIRHWGFYPVLRLAPEAQPRDLDVSERGLVWTLNLPLVEVVPDVEALIAGLGSGLVLAGTSSTPDGVTASSVDDAISAGRGFIEGVGGRALTESFAGSRDHLRAASRIGRDGYTPRGWGYSP